MLFRLTLWSIFFVSLFVVMLCLLLVIFLSLFSKFVCPFVLILVTVYFVDFCLTVVILILFLVITCLFLVIFHCFVAILYLFASISLWDHLLSIFVSCLSLWSLFVVIFCLFLVIVLFVSGVFLCLFNPALIYLKICSRLSVDLLSILYLPKYNFEVLVFLFYPTLYFYSFTTGNGNIAQFNPLHLSDIFYYPADSQ